MSLSELAQIMREAGLASAGSDASASNGMSSDNKFRVEHIFVLDVSEKWEKIVKGVALGCLDLGRHFVHSIRVLAVAGSIGFLLWGTSRLIDSLRQRKTKDANRSSSM